MTARTLLHNLDIAGGADGRRPAGLLLEGERIEAVLAPGEPVGEARRVDLGGALVLPAAIDVHVHFDDPGFTRREDFATGTRAAAAGGVGCVADMPCTSIPPVTSVENLRAKLEVIAPKAHVDFVLWGGVSADLMEEGSWEERLDGLVREGIGAVKVYLLSGMDSFRDLSPGQLSRVFGAAAALGIPVGVHAEDRELVLAATRRIREAGGDGPLDYAASRPAEAEIRAARTVVAACRATGARAHVVHVASVGAVEVLGSARREGLAVSAETCPHFLAHTVEDLERLGSLLKTAPVVKSAADREGLWRALASGELAFVASDHAAGVWPEEKNTGSIWTDYGGVPGVELLLPYLFSEGVGRGRLTLERLVEVTATAPAEFLGIGRRKGRLAPGYDADLAVLDPEERWTVRAAELHNKNRYTPLEGWELVGRVRETWVRGRRVFWRDAAGDHLAEPSGRWIRRERPV